MFYRGVSSTVRRCVEKDTGDDFAVKIIDLTGDKDNEAQMEEIRMATHKEMNILRMCKGHQHVSKYGIRDTLTDTLTDTQQTHTRK